MHDARGLGPTVSWDHHSHPVAPPDPYRIPRFAFTRGQLRRRRDAHEPSKCQTGSFRPQGASLAGRALHSKTALGSTLAEFAYGFGDSSKPCLAGPGSFDRENKTLLVNEGQPVKESIGDCI